MGDCFLITHQGEYLVAMSEIPTGSGHYFPAWSLYKYDAARIETADLAKKAARLLARKIGGECKVIAFNQFSGTAEEIYTTAMGEGRF